MLLFLLLWQLGYRLTQTQFLYEFALQTMQGILSLNVQPDVLVPYWGLLNQFSY